MRKIEVRNLMHIAIKKMKNKLRRKRKKKFLQLQGISTKKKKIKLDVTLGHSMELM